MAFEYDKFDIVEVGNQCGLQFYSRNTGGVEFKANCPFCDDRKYHLGLNRNKERFQCLKCGVKGNAVSLYAKIYGISNKEAYEALISGGEVYRQKAYACAENTETPICPLEKRHNVYYDFLNMLNLDRKHRYNLENRGLSFSQMYQFMYRSIPTDPVFRREVLEKLARVHSLKGVPGFYIDEYGDNQMYFKKCGGIFVPVCNHEGYIQGLQMRLDVPENSDEKKYRWFSSKHFPNGTGAKPWIHVVGDIAAEEACLVEGAMKADITSVLSEGKLFIAIPGVNAIAYLPEVINNLRIKKIYEALDMDKLSKPEVKKALIVLKKTLTDIGIGHKSCSWNPKYKGLDDYFYARTMCMEPQLAAA